ncbi:agmatine deiminase [Helicobacter sp. 12S02634-8]|uniref:agmatine deiminase family protein n=1 Tax=Helicobacter sp. 12S02634-8 TaxID=1476199 RepID=UPI000BA79B58|nr:agmatine deiminase family protein [Helicobacter sp. 12S02634-8]PAF48506.1 agmatine deiminase [Helicobacter sp. 12S02634-8]
MQGKTKRFKAEWERQRAVLMAFPHEKSDWIESIEAARENFLAIIREIARFEPVWVCIDPDDLIGKAMLQHLQIPQVKLLEIPVNDTWARDFGPISIEEDGCVKLLDFGFNGWGLKFRSDKDNQVNTRLSAAGILPHAMTKMPLILEGGSIDTDGQGRLLTNTQCLLEPNRNPHLSQSQIEANLKEVLGVQEVLWLHSGYLVGDDTDGHIDTLVRFLNPQTIAYVQCEDKNDVHYAPLQKMQDELLALKNAQGKPYTLIPLPLPSAIDDGKQRLPATYANFLFINNALLVPTYGDKKDAQVLEILQKNCSDKEVIGIDCRTLIKQHGSLHCVTMQIY